MTEKTEATPIRMAGSNALRQGQHAYRSWFVTVPHGADPKALLNPGFWRHHVQSLRPLDVIRAVCEDGTWEMWLTVIKPDLAQVFVSKLFHATHENVESVEAEDLKVEWKGPAMQFCVVRDKSNEVLRKNLYPKSVAEAELLRLRTKAA